MHRQQSEKDKQNVDVSHWKISGDEHVGWVRSASQQGSSANKQGVGTHPKI